MATRKRTNPAKRRSAAKKTSKKKSEELAANSTRRKAAAKKASQRPGGRKEKKAPAKKPAKKQKPIVSKKTAKAKPRKPRKPRLTAKQKRNRDRALKGHETRRLKAVYEHRYAPTKAQDVQQREEFYSVIVDEVRELGDPKKLSDLKHTFLYGFTRRDLSMAKHFSIVRWFDEETRETIRQRMFEAEELDGERGAYFEALEIAEDYEVDVREVYTFLKSE